MDLVFVGIASAFIGFFFGMLFMSLYSESEENGYGLTMTASKAKKLIKKTINDDVKNELKRVFRAINNASQEVKTSIECYVGYPENVKKLTEKGFTLKEKSEGYYLISWGEVQ